MTTLPDSVHDLIASGDAHALDGAGFAEMVSGATDKQLREVMTHPDTRTLILDRIFGQMGERVRPDRVRGIDAVVHWHVTGGPAGAIDRFQVHIRDGAAVVTRNGEDKAKVTMIVDPVGFLRMIAGETTGMKLMLGRKLRVKGDMMFAPRLEHMFNTDPAAL